MYDWVLSEVDATFLLCYFCLNGENCAFPFSLFCNKTIVLGPREHKAAVMRIHYQIINKCANTSISLQVFVLWQSSLRYHEKASIHQPWNMKNNRDVNTSFWKCSTYWVRKQRAQNKERRREQTNWEKTEKAKSIR